LTSIKKLSKEEVKRIMGDVRYNLDGIGARLNQVERCIASNSDTQTNGDEEEDVIINAVPLNTITANSALPTNNSHDVGSPSSRVIILD